jgi:PAS domain S-box-containing protein
MLFFFVRPLRRALHEKALAQEALRAACQDLDAKVTERTARLEAANLSLRQTEARCSAVVEQSPMGIFILLNGRIVFGNQRMFEILAMDRPARPDLDPTPFIHPDDRDMVQAVWRRRAAGEESIGGGDYRIIDAQGQLRWIWGRTTPLELPEGTALLGTIQDVTERHEAERALAQSREDLRQLSARLLTVQEEERRRVAQELHDGIGQSLTAVKFMVERALKGACDQPKGCHMEVLHSVIPVLRQTVEETRRICMALRPSTLDDLGLIATLRWFVREFQKACPHLIVDLDIGLEESEFPQGLKTSIFRIVQEAMNNAAKHAQAGRLAVTIAWIHGELLLTVRDDGKGFDPCARRDPTSTGGLGLDSMKERAECHDGVLRIESARGQGTTITVRWPLIEDPDFLSRYYPEEAR